MNTRPRRFQRWPCEFTPTQIERIRALANEADQMPYAEMTRRLIDHALNCPFFIPDASAPRNPQPIEGGK